MGLVLFYKFNCAEEQLPNYQSTNFCWKTFKALEGGGEGLLIKYKLENGEVGGDDGLAVVVLVLQGWVDRV